MRGTTYKRCGCKHPDTGRPLNQNCPQLRARRHGSWTFDVYIDTTGKDQRRLKRGGYETQREAEAALDQVRDLVKLAVDDDKLKRRIGDHIFTQSRRGGTLPSVDEMRRRLGAGEDIAAASATVGEWLEEWYLIKQRSLQETTLNGYRQHIDRYLIPMLGDIPRDKLRPEHIAGMIDTFAEWNEELKASREEGRAYNRPDDLRVRRQFMGVNTQHKVLATLRSAYATAVKRPGMIKWNPCSAVEMPPRTRATTTVWGPDEVMTFLEGTKDDRIGLLYRIVLLRGLRRGEAVGLREEDLDDDDSGATLRHTILQVSDRVFSDTPKSDAGHRWVSFDAETQEGIRARRRARRRERLAAGELWQEHGLVFCQEDGTPLRPSIVSWNFRKRAADLGLPVIRLHDGRHTAATLGLEAGLDIKVVSDQLGHANTTITRDLYTHVRQAVHDEAAESVVQLLNRSRTAAESGS